MMFRNSFKLLLSNFSLVWKSAVYKILCVLAVFLISLNWVGPVVSAFKEANLLGEIWNFLFNGTFALDADVVKTSFQKIVMIFASDAVGALSVNIVLVIVICFVILPFLLGLSNLAECEVLYGSMSSNSSYSYTACFIRTLKKSIKLELSKLVISVPFDISICSGVVFISTLLCLTNSLPLFAPFLITLFVVIFMALRKTLMAGIEGAIIVKDYPTIKAYVKGYKVVNRRFGRVFSTMIMLLVAALFVNALVTSFTFGVGLIITLPITFVLFSIVKMVIYYSSEGMDFYVEPEIICHSKRFEEQLTVKANKYII